MKRCTYCGKEYPDDAVSCLIDGQPLDGGEVQGGTVGKCGFDELSQSEPGALPASATSSSSKLTDRQLRITELALVCAIAFSSGILSSFYFLLDPTIHAAGNGPTKWTFGVIREGLVLVLLWYVLLRRSKGFSDIGFAWRWKHDIGWSIVLRIAAFLAFTGIFHAAYFLAYERAEARYNISDYLFYGGITFATIVYQFVNPFFEELIVRAYVMTEVKELTGSSAMAILLSTALQTSYHFYQGIPAAVALGSIFLIFSIYFAKTKRIAPVILAHLYMDVGYTLWHLYHH